jgi:organic hydroperoxide reductase OsmC/OhrA
LITPGIDEAKFDECLAGAKTNCPISKLFKNKISIEATVKADWNSGE